jgi:integrase/recombinase XerD
MASIRKRKGRDGKLADKYSIRYKDANGDWKTAVGCADLESSRKLAAKLESNAALRRNGVEDVDLKADLPLKDFETDLRASGCVESHVALTVRQIRNTFKACGITTLRDLMKSDTATRINSQLAGQKCKQVDRPISQRTRNSYVTAIRQFVKWLVDSDRLPYCKLGTNLVKVEQTTKVVQRRAATAAELTRILKAAKAGNVVEGLTGEQRYWLYRVAAATGFRARELHSLKPPAFKLREATPIIVVEGAYTKNGDVANQPIRPELAAELAKWLRGKAKDELVWPGGWYRKAAEMLRVDLKAAEVVFNTGEGRLDLHALRHTYVTSLSDAGVHPKTAQELARHSTIDLTMNFYTHLQTAKLAAALPKAV